MRLKKIIVFFLCSLLTVGTYRGSMVAMNKNYSGININLPDETNVRLREFVLNRQITKLKTKDKKEALKIPATISEVVCEALEFYFDAKKEEMSDDLASGK